MAVTPSGVANWIPSATCSDAAGLAVPSSALRGTVAFGSSETVTDDIRRVMLALLDRVYLEYVNTADADDPPTKMSISKAVTSTKVQFSISVDINGNQSFPTYA